jgi:hypothetical protein
MDSYGGVSSGCKCWLALLGGMLGLSSSLEHGGRQMLGINSQSCLSQTRERM